jgi:hypothetical protein
LFPGIKQYPFCKGYQFVSGDKNTPFTKGIDLFPGIKQYPFCKGYQFVSGDKNTPFTKGIDLFPGIKRPGCGIDHSPLLRVKVKERV